MKELDFSRIMSEKEALERYHAAAHKMQSGVAMKMQWDPGETSSKHVRVGVNSAMVDSAALAELLMHKGLITTEEYLTALALGMEREAEAYQKEIQAYYPNTKVELG